MNKFETQTLFQMVLDLLPSGWTAILYFNLDKSHIDNIKNNACSVGGCASSQKIIFAPLKTYKGLEYDISTAEVIFHELGHARIHALGLNVSGYMHEVMVDRFAAKRLEEFNKKIRRQFKKSTLSTHYAETVFTGMHSWKPFKIKSTSWRISKSE
jgi:hypothetical protein